MQVSNYCWRSMTYTEIRHENTISEMHTSLIFADICEVIKCDILLIMS